MELTHDELLAKINAVFYEDEGGTQLDLAGFNNQYRAIRAVVELHKPYETTPPWGYDKYLACFACEEYTNDGAYNSEYPCKTIQAITKELE